MARLLRPWQDLVRRKLHAAKLDDATRRLAWFHLTNSYNSDGQWPPTLPTAPHIVHPFNYGYCFENLLQAELLVGGVDHSKLKTKGAGTLAEVLTLQQDLILKKAKQLVASGTKQQKCDARTAATLIETSRNVDSVKATKNMLFPSDYAVRVNALVAAPQLVGGVEIEVVEDMQGGTEPC